jgi:hypothetical protein
VIQCSLVYSVQLKAGFAHRIKISARSNTVAWRLITLTSAQYMDMMTIKYYKLGTKYCRHQYKNGGVYIFVHESIDFDSISTHPICKEKDLEICAVKLYLPKIKIGIITIYRSPTGNYNYFVRKLESLLNLLYKKNGICCLWGNKY